MVKFRSAIEISKHLPATNCGDCRKEVCLEFALALMDRSASIEQCPHLTPFQKGALEKLLAPPMNWVSFGVGERAVKIGGEEVMYRHEMSFMSPTALALDISDQTSEDLLTKRIKEVDGVSYERLFKVMKPNALAIRSPSGDPAKFSKTVSKAVELTNLPLILCSLDPKVLRAGVEVAKERRPLLYAATKDNWREVLALAEEYSVAVALSSPSDLDTLGSLSQTFLTRGVSNLVLDPGISPSPGALAQGLSNYLALRRACVEGGVKELSFPVMAVPAAVYQTVKDPREAAYYETTLSSALITKGISLLILHSLHPWTLAPLLNLRQGIFTWGSGGGRGYAETAVKAGLYEFNEPSDMSPLLVTANFALTYTYVSGDLEKGKVKAHLLVLDTQGISVGSAVGGGIFSADAIVDAIKEFKVEEKVKHRSIVLPDFAREFKQEFEELMPGWVAIVGPKDSHEIPAFLKDKWLKILEEYQAQKEREKKEGVGEVERPERREGEKLKVVRTGYQDL